PPTPTLFPYTTLFRSVRLAVGLHERLRVTQRSPRPVGQVPAMVALRDEHDRGRASAQRDVEGRLHPSDVGQVPRGVLGRIWRRVAEIVARALDVQGRVGDATSRPAAILDTGDEPVHTETQRLGPHFLAQPTLPERE